MSGRVRERRVPRLDKARLDGGASAAGASGNGGTVTGVSRARVSPAGASAAPGLEADLRRLGPWFHNLHLPGGVQTAPEHPLGDFPSYKWKVVAEHIPERLDGWTALDIGCNAGFYTFELARRGAEVVGVDHDERYLAQARWAAERLDLADRVELRRGEVYDLGRSEERWDLVLFMGVLYHLRYPLLGLDVMARKTRKLMVFQSLMLPGEETVESTGGLGLDDRDALLQPGWPSMAFLEHDLADDPTNWWVPNRAAVEAMLRSTGMHVLARPEREIFVCRPEPDSFASGGQLAAALGLSREP
jgi:tRNA (mo5U34)-methyltransferase